MSQKTRSEPLPNSAAAKGVHCVISSGPTGIACPQALLASAALNYWFWPQYGTHTLKLKWFQFLYYGPNRGKLLEQ